MHFRYGPLIVSVALFAAAISAACADDIEDEDLSAVPSKGGTGSGGTGGEGGGPPPACMPTASECYLNGISGPGAECMAKRDNPNATQNPGHFQLRQVWSRNTRPAGLASGVLVPALAMAETLISDSCNIPGGPFSGGYMLLMDWNKTGPLESQTALVGYANRVPGGTEAAALQSGLCMSAFKYTAKGADTDISRQKIGEALWSVRPTLSKRRADDFDIAAIRKTPDVDEEGEGIFYADDDEGDGDGLYLHGYAHTTYVVVNVADQRDAVNTLNVVPIREPELTIYPNDASQNCVGRYRAHALDINADPPCQSSSAENPVWGCTRETDCASGDGTCCEPGKSNMVVRGYFKIIDLERVLTVFGETLCVSYVGQATAVSKGWAKPVANGGWGLYCSGSPDWGTNNANDPLRGGDWCSAENKAADGKCVADSWRTETFFAMQAFPIQVGTTCKPADQQAL